MVPYTWMFWRLAGFFIENGERQLWGGYVWKHVAFGIFWRAYVSPENCDG